MSHKNTLQEIYQKTGDVLPTYITVKVPDGSGFISTVILPEEQTFKGIVCAKKKQAEISAAKKACEVLIDQSKHIEHYTSNYTILEPQEPDTANRFIFIDLENINITNDVYKHLTKDTDAVYGFISIYHANYGKQYPFEVKVIKSPAKEAADHAMSFFAGTMIKYIRNKPVIIISGDQSASNLAYLLDNVTIYTTLKDFVKSV